MSESLLCPECKKECPGGYLLCEPCYEKLLAELATEKEKNRWIPVGERLPEVFDIPHPHSKRVLMCVEEDITEMDGGVTIGYYSKEKGWRTDYDLSMLKVTHWKPITLPEGE